MKRHNLHFTKKALGIRKVYFSMFLLKSHRDFIYCNIKKMFFKICILPAKLLYQEQLLCCVKCSPPAQQQVADTVQAVEPGRVVEILAAPTQYSRVGQYVNHAERTFDPLYYTTPHLGNKIRQDSNTGKIRYVRIRIRVEPDP